VEEVKRPTVSPKARIVIGSAMALFVVLLLMLTFRGYRTPEVTPPDALAHIAEKNHNAAVTAAAHQRAESAASTSAAEQLAEARRRGADEANAALARFPDEENRAQTPGRRD
jgi:hypothetical protein